MLLQPVAVMIGHPSGHAPEPIDFGIARLAPPPAVNMPIVHPRAQWREPFLTLSYIRHTSGISGGFRQLRIYVSAVMADFETFVMRPKEDTARDKLIPRKLVRQSRGDTKEEDVICYHSAHCRQILSIKTPLSSPSNSRII